MFYSFSIIPFVTIIHYIFIYISNANPSVEDNMVIGIMKGHPKIQINEYSVQKYEAHLGILYFMRTNWKCDKIHEKFEDYERTECQKYRKYLDILYGYLIREYVGIPTVKPKNVFKREIEIEGSIIYAVNCLANISQFYLNAEESEHYDYKLNELFYKHFEPKLLNEQRLNYEFKLKNKSKLPINEMILQLAIETANEWQTKWQTNESLDGIIKQKFEENLEKMLKKAEQKAKKDKPLKANEINDDKHLIILNTKFDDQRTWTEDVLFLEFVKGLATNFDEFYKTAKEYSNFELCEIEEMKVRLTLEYKVRLLLMYLMRKNWNCEKIGKEFEEKCQKYRKYLDILYEYFFRIFVEAKNPNVSKQLPPLVKPIFLFQGFLQYSLIKVVIKLNGHYNLFKFGQKNENIFGSVGDIREMALVNEDELNHEIKELKSCENSSTNSELEIELANLQNEFEKNGKNLKSVK